VRAVLVAGAVTLLVTLVRLIGELSKWDPRFFNHTAGGPGAIVGIGWLMAPFGFWFGRLVAAAHGRPPMRRAWLLTALPLALLIGALLTFRAMHPDDLKALLPVVAFGLPLAALVTVLAWPRAFGINLMYALLARAPVIVITYIAVACDWDTHYSNIRPEAGAKTAAERANGLVMAQAVLWIPSTILVGGVFALLGALTVRAAAAPDSPALE
jgi:hypothetical protein